MVNYSFSGRRHTHCQQDGHDNFVGLKIYRSSFSEVFIVCFHKKDLCYDKALKGLVGYVLQLIVNFIYHSQKKNYDFGHYFVKPKGIALSLFCEVTM